MMHNIMLYFAIDNNDLPKCKVACPTNLFKQCIEFQFSLISRVLRELGYPLFCPLQVI